MSNTNRRGEVLLEVLVAAVLLATAGIALLGVLGQTARTLHDVTITERSTQRAADELDGLVTLDRAAVLARLGLSERHGWFVDVSQISVALFDVSIAETDTSRPLLRTTLYRPDSIDASP